MPKLIEKKRKNIHKRGVAEKKRKAIRLKPKNRKTSGPMSSVLRTIIESVIAPRSVMAMSNIQKEIFFARHTQRGIGCICSVFIVLIMEEIFFLLLPLPSLFSMMLSFLMAVFFIAAFSKNYHS